MSGAVLRRTGGLVGCEPALSIQRVIGAWLTVLACLWSGAALASADGTLCQTPSAIAGSLSLGDCEEVDPATIDVRQVVDAMRSCDLGEDISVEEEFKYPELANPIVRIKRGQHTITEFPLEPQLQVHTKGFGLHGMLACDSARRFFVMHPYVGYLAAYNASGNQLWLQMLPGFVPITAMLSDGAEEVDLATATAAFDAGSSRGSQVQVSGDFVLAEFKTGGKGTFQAVFHRSGGLVGTVGPWDGRALASTAAGWTIVAGGGPDMRFYVPTAKYELIVNRDDCLESVIRHALAWLEPRPIDRELKFNCMSRPVDEIAHWLRDDFRVADSRRARDALIRLGGADWFDQLIRTDAVAAVARRFDPHSDSWRDEYRSALIDSGVDVAIARVLTETN